MNCTQSLQSLLGANQLDTVEALRPNVDTDIQFSPGFNQLFSINVAQQETVKFTISLQTTQQPNNIGVTVSFFQIVSNSVISLGSAQITEMFLQFQKDFTQGEYYVCIRSTVFSYTGIFKGDFTGFQIYAILSPRAYHGQALNPTDIEFGIVKKLCSKLLLFDFLGGSLPPGLSFTGYGRVIGVLPNLDCIEDNKDLSPSQNWYYNTESTWAPWGRQWRFLVRVFVADYPEAFVDDWFCVRVYNNWSWDRDNLKPPFEYEIDEEIPAISSITLPDQLCCDDTVPPPPQLTPIVPIPCPCESESDTEKAIQLNFLQWYQTIIRNPPEANNPDIQKFINDFRTTEYYKTMIVKSGLESTLFTAKELELKVVQETIDSFLRQLNTDGRAEHHIDSVMLTMKHEVNQTLPITVEAQSGESCIATLSQGLIL
jgi:hypothetical protein